MKTSELIELFRCRLIRSDGQLNSPRLVNKKNSELIALIVEATSYLDAQATVSRRWWHLQHGRDIPKCKECGKESKWRDGKYTRFCSQLCASTSEEASIRTRNQFKGVQRSQESRRKQSASTRGRKRSAETKEKLRLAKLGDKNPRYQKQPWNKGVFGSINPQYGKRRPGTGSKGEKNGQYGKSPSPRAGRGIWGKFKGLHFRSSLELFYLMYWFESGVNVESAEKEEFRVKYIDSKGNMRTYSPDFIIRSNNLLLEIKPEKMHIYPDIINKLQALKSKHQHMKCELWGFEKICAYISKALTNSAIESYLKAGLLQMNERQIERLKRNYADILRAIRPFDVNTIEEKEIENGK